MRNNAELVLRRITLFAAAAFLLTLTACYFHNTPFFPSTEGFHTVKDSPFESGERSINGIAGNGEVLVAVSNGGTVAWSADTGLTWNAVAAENIKDNFNDGIRFNAVTWGSGYFLAVGAEGRAAYSSDGINWQAGVIGPMSPKNILCVAAGSIGGRTVFAAAGQDGRLAHATDSPAGPWYMADQTPFGFVQDFGDDVLALAWGEIKGNGIFVAAGTNGRIAILKDLSGKWYGARAGTGQTFRTVAFGNERFIAAGDNGLIKYSLDPLSYTWTTVKDEILELRSVMGMTFDPAINQFILYTADSVVGFSEFGDSWRASNFKTWHVGGFTAPESISSVACSASRIFLGGSRGTIVYSN